MLYSKPTATCRSPIALKRPDFCCHIYHQFTRKRIVSLYFGRDVRTCWVVAIFDVSGAPVFHIKVEASR